MAQVSRDGRRFVLWYSLALVVLLAVPFLLAHATAGGEWEFSGFLIGVEDGNSYIAKMRRATEGDWLFRSPYSTFPQDGVVAFLPYVLLGKLAGGAGMHVQLVSLFHLARSLLIPVEVLAVYRFAACFIEEQRWRRWIVVMATIGGGLGWLLVVAGQSWFGGLPLDFYSPETFGFLALFGLPHLVLARALLLFGLTDYIRSGESGRRGWRAGLWLALLALVHPLSSVVAGIVLAAHVGWVALCSALRKTWADFRPVASSAVRSVLPMSPLLLYYTWAFSTDPYLRGWTVQNRILSPHPVHYLLAYGLVLAPAIAGGIALARQPAPFKWVLVSWILALPLMAYAPTSLQRRLPEGAWVALAILAALGLSGLRKVTTRRQWGLALALLVLSLPSTLILWLGGLQLAARPAEPAFLPVATTRAFAWIDEHIPAGSVVGADFALSNALPAWADVVVVAGHGPESVNLGTNLPRLEALLEGETQAAGRAFLTEHSIDALLLGPAQARLPAWSVPLPEWMAVLYAEDGYVILGIEH
jgi:hypothetical protein